MKGQTVNIDWSTGLALFLVTILSSVVFLVDPLAVQTNRALENVAVDVQQNLQEDGGRENIRNSFYIRSSDTIEDVPFDRKYYYSNILGTGVTDQPAHIDVPENRFAAVTDTDNSSIDLIYFQGDYEPPSYYSDLQTSPGKISNSKITLNHGSNIGSVSIGGNDAIDSISIDGSSSTTENDVFVSAFSDNLKVFNGTSEFIVEDNSIVVTTKNYSTLYWHPDGNQTLAGTGTFKTGTTPGLTVADPDLGVTFMGDLDANVSKPDSSTVRIEIDAPKTRIRLHESGAGYGERRIEAFDDREAFFGAEKVYRSYFRSDLENLEAMSQRDFEIDYSLVNYGYNITVFLNRNLNTESSTAQSLSSQADWNTGSFESTSGDRNDNSGTLGMGYLNGTSANSLTDGLVAYWRMDRSVSGDGGTVIDYSGYGNDGTTSGAVSTGLNGVFGTSSSNLTSGSISTSQNFNGTIKTVAFWVKSTKQGGSWNTILDWDVENEDGTQSARVELDGQGDRLYTRWIVDPTSEGYNTGDGGTWSRSGSYSYNDSQWHLYTSTFDGDDIIEYWDGEVYSTSTGINSEVANMSSGGIIRLRSGNIQPKYDEVMIYNRSLSQSEVEQIYMNGMDGEFNATYTGPKTDSSEVRDWESIRIDASLPASTDLDAIVYSYDEDGNTIDSQNIDVDAGDNTYDLNLDSSRDAQVVFRGSSTDPAETWTVEDVSILAAGEDVERNLFARGQSIPFRDTTVSTRQINFISEDGEIKQARSRVVVWR